MPIKIDEQGISRVAFVRSLLYLILISMTVAACKKENDAPLWDVDALLPIAKTTLTISDVLADSVHTVGVDNGISITFNEELFALDIDTVLEIPDTTYAYRYGLPFPGPLSVAGGTNVLSDVDESKINLDQVELNLVRVREGAIRVEGISMISVPTVADLELPNTDLAGNPVQVTVNMPPGSPSNPSVVITSVDIAGYDFDLTGTMMNDVNTLTNSVNFSTAASAPPVDITDQDSIIAFLYYEGIVPQYARGYFGMESLDASESVDLEFFKDFISGTLDLDQVKVYLKISNSIGVDAQVYLNSLNAVNTSTATTVGLNHAIMTGPINISRGTDTGNEGVASFQEIELINGNSNIDDFVENLPDKLDYELDILINPLGNISNGNDFLYYDSELRIDLETDIPLCVIADDLVLRKAFDVDLPGSSEGHAVQSGKLNLFITNGFPLSANVEMAVVDDDNIVQTNLQLSGAVVSANVDGGGNVTSAVSEQLIVDMSKDDVDALYDHERVVLTVTFNSPLAGQHIKIKDTHFMDLQLTADLNYLVNGDE